MSSLQKPFFNRIMVVVYQLMWGVHRLNNNSLLLNLWRCYICYIHLSLAADLNVNMDPKKQRLGAEWLLGVKYEIGCQLLCEQFSMNTLKTF